MTQRSGRAIIIGASMGGLLAARALADHFAEVVLLERDYFPPSGENRKGVPQGRHTHGLLGRGREVMEGFFPGLSDELVALGALRGDSSGNIRWFTNGGYHLPGTSGQQGLAVSRPTLEGQVRARLLALPNVRAIEGCDVRGLLASDDGSRIIGVRLLRQDAGDSEEALAADLVVDASGRGSRTPAWLEALGYSRPAEERIAVGLRYTTCTYRRDPQKTGEVHGIFVAASPTDPRGAALLAQEGDRWVVSIGTYTGQQAPADHVSVREYLKGLATSEVYNRISDAEPLGEPVQYSFPASVRRRYEDMRRFPAGLLVVADAICSFNPVYGQGMTVAALEAAILDRCLAQGRDRLAQRFFAEASALLDLLWQSVKTFDLRFPHVAGRRTPLMLLLTWYLDRLHIAARSDTTVSVAFLNVVNLVAPPTSVLRPSIALRVLWGNLRARYVRSDLTAEHAESAEDSSSSPLRSLRPLR